MKLCSIVSLNATVRLLAIEVTRPTEHCDWCLDWGNLDHVKLLPFAQYDIILGADVGYFANSNSRLVKTLAVLCAPDGTVWLSHRCRSQSEARFFELLRIWFDCFEEHLDPSLKEGSPNITLWRLTRKPDVLPPTLCASFESSEPCEEGIDSTEWDLFD